MHDTSLSASSLACTTDLIVPVFDHPVGAQQYLAMACAQDQRLGDLQPVIERYLD
jgi:hypothetical protein